MAAVFFAALRYNASGAGPCGAQFTFGQAVDFRISARWRHDIFDG
jgi:hypothetical protein